MNEAIKSALAAARTAAEEALTAAQTGDHATARQLLAIMDDELTSCETGNAAVRQSRAKTLRIEAEVRTLLPDLTEMSEPAAPEAAPEVETAAQAEEALPAPAPVTEPAPEAEADLAPTPAAAAPLEAVTLAVQPSARNIAPAHTLDADAWARVAAALQVDGETTTDVAQLRLDAERHAAAQVQARVGRKTFVAKVEEARSLQALVMAGALTGDVAAANKAWDRLFDVTTSIRGAAQKAIREGQPDPVKNAAYDQAREFAKRIKAWARAPRASAAA